MKTVSSDGYPPYSDVSYKKMQLSTFADLLKLPRGDGSIAELSAVLNMPRCPCEETIWDTWWDSLLVKAQFSPICLVTSCLAILIVLLATNVQKSQIVIDLRRWMQRSIQRTEIHSKPSFYNIVLHCRGCMWSPILLFKKRQGSRARCLFDFLNRHCMSCTGRSCCLNSQGFVFHLLGCRCPSIKGALE